MQHFTGQDDHTRADSGLQEPGGWNNDWALSQKIIAGRRRHRRAVRDGRRRVSDASFFGEQNDGLILRERWMPQPGLLERLGRALRARHLHRASCVTKRCSRCSRFVPAVRLDRIDRATTTSRTQARARRTAAIARASPGSSTLVHRRHRGRRAQRAGRRRPLHRHRPSRQSAARRTRRAASQAKSAVAVLDNINELETCSYERSHRRSQHERNADRRPPEARRQRPVRSISPASASSITCWSCSPSTAASI